MITAVVKLTTRPGMRPPLLEAMRGPVAATAAQEMCFSVELLAGIENENELILIEKWATVEDHQSFIGGVIEEGGLDALMPLLDGEIETSHYRAAD